MIATKAIDSRTIPVNVLSKLSTTMTTIETKKRRTHPMIAKRDSNRFMMLELLELFYSDDQEWGGGRSLSFRYTPKTNDSFIFFWFPP